MHFVFGTRGNKADVEAFIQELQETYLTTYAPDLETKKNVKHYRKILVQPLQLWSIAFGEESRDLVLNTILNGSDGKSYSMKNWIIIALRKLLGLKEIGDYKKDKILLATQKNMETIAIGIKEDYWIDNLTGEHYISKKNKKPGREYFEGI